MASGTLDFGTPAPAAPPAASPFPTWARIGFAVLAVLVGAAIGVAAGLGISPSYLAAGAVAPFLVIVMLARPHWAATAFVVLVYADLLSILVQFHGFPPLARFASAALLTAVLGYRLLVRKQGLASDEMTLWLAGYAVLVGLGLIYARQTDPVTLNLVEFARNFITYLIIVNTLTTARRFRGAVMSLLAAGTLLSALTIFQSVTGKFDDNFGGLAQYRVSEIAGGEDAPRPSGTLADANYYGQLLIMVMPFALFLMFDGRSRPLKALGALATLILAGGIVFTYSRGDALALGAMLLATVIYKRPPPAALLAGILLLVVAIPLLPGGYVARLSTVVDTALGRHETILNEASIRGRAGAVQAAFGMFGDYPVLGVGRENYASYELDYISGTSYAYSGKGIPPHDLYLEIAAEHGTVGILFFAGLLLATLGAVREARRLFLSHGDREQAELAAWLGIGLFGYLVSSLFLHGAYLYMLWLQISMIVALRQVARHSSEDARLASLRRGFTRTAEGAN